MHKLDINPTCVVFTVQFGDYHASASGKTSKHPNATANSPSINTGKSIHQGFTIFASSFAEEEHGIRDASHPNNS
jgi:dolichol kinase